MRDSERQCGVWVELLIREFNVLPHCLDRAALCQFLRRRHRLAKVELDTTPLKVAVAALSTDSSTMEELKWTCHIPVRAFIHCTQ